MVTAIILVRAERSKVQDVAQQLLDMHGITEVYSVAGAYDLVAIARVAENQCLAELVTGSMGQVGGVTRTETLIAFQSFSKFDLERMFSIGME